MFMFYPDRRLTFLLTCTDSPSPPQDAAYQERRQDRATILYDKSHSVSHNIITGEPIKMPIPVKPQR